MSSLSILKGRTRIWLIRITNPANGAPLDLSGLTVEAQVATALSDTDLQAILTGCISVAAGGSVTSATDMTIGGTDTSVDPPVTYTGAASGVIFWEPSLDSTKALTPGTYPFEIAVKTSDTPPRIYQGLSGTVTIMDTQIDTVGCAA